MLWVMYIYILFFKTETCTQLNFVRKELVLILIYVSKMPHFNLNGDWFQIG